MIDRKDKTHLAANETGLENNISNAELYANAVTESTRFSALAGHGFSVFPLLPRDKRPLGSWKIYQTQRAGEEALSAWEKDSRNLNVGIATGAVSDIIVLDVDSAEGQREVDRRGLPRTPTTRTAKGRHYYLKHPGFEVRNFARKLLGCDLRGDGGYVVAPGSIHPSGAKYAWEISPGEVDFAECPEWLLALIRPPESTPPANVVSIADRLPQGKHSGYVGRALQEESRRVKEAAEGTRNDQLNKSAYALGQLVGAGVLEKKDAEAMLRAAALEVGLDEQEIQATLNSGMREGIRKPRDLDNVVAFGGGSNGPGPHRVIRWKPGELPAVIDQAEQALLEAGVEIYQRGGMLVRPVTLRDETVHGYRQSAGRLKVIPVEAAWLQEKLTVAAGWEKFDGRSNSWRPMNAPEQVAKTYMARRDWGVPSLVATIETPTLRPDGSILDRPGYDDETGLLFAPGRFDFGEIPASPSIGEARAGLALLKRVLAGFPFEKDHDRSVALSAILTALIRRSLRSAPLYAFSAPVMGSGKTLLADVVALIATGCRVTVMPPTDDANEEKKRLLAVLMEADPVVCIDNVEKPFSSDALCAVLTQETYKDRVLGLSSMVTTPTNCTWMATGNNLQIVGDLTTRVLRCNLDPRVERPQERRFDVNLHQWIPENRRQIVQAGLSILRAYHVAGRPMPEDVAPFGRFEEWSNWVRGALLWLGEADPVEAQRELEAADPIREALRGVLTAWHKCFESSPVTVKQVIEYPPDGERQGWSELQDALKAAIPGGQYGLNPRKVGNWLAKHARRVQEGLCFEQVGKRQGAVLWRVVQV